MPKQADQKPKIIAAWREWRRQHASNPASSHDPLVFYGWLEENRPDLLDFRFSGSDKYQLVKTWAQHVV